MPRRTSTGSGALAEHAGDDDALRLDDASHVSPAARAVEIAITDLTGPISGSLDRLELVRFEPVSLHRSKPLNPPA